MFVNPTSVCDSNSYSKVESNRIDKLDTMFQTFMKKVDNIDQKVKESNDKSTRKKKNHPENPCFKIRTCYKCNSKGYIPKFCIKMTQILVL